MPTKQCCDRSVIERTLEALLHMLSHNMKGLNSLATQHAEEMGLDSLGVFEEPPEGARPLSFPIDFNNKLRIKWDEVDAQLATIGRPTGLYAVPKSMYLGIRGENGDVLVRLIDIQQRRLDGVLEYLKDHPVIPPWFEVGAKLLFRGSGPVTTVVSIDPVQRSWIGEAQDDQAMYPLNEVATQWGPA
jgi:hypothetical protein